MCEYCFTDDEREVNDYWPLIPDCQCLCIRELLVVTNEGKRCPSCNHLQHALRFVVDGPKTTPLDSQEANKRSVKTSYIYFTNTILLAIK